MLLLASAQVAGSVILLACLGWLVLSAIERTFGKAGLPGEFAALFVTMATGILVAVFSFSLMRTGGRTSNWAILPPLIAAIWAWPNKTGDRSEPRRIGRRPMAFAVCAILLAVVWFAPRTVAGPDLVLRPLARDDAFYVTVVEALLGRGLETTASLEALLPGTAVEPKVYHYFELWLGAFFAWLWRAPTAFALRFHADVVLLVTVMSGLAALLERVRGTSLRILATALLLPFLEWWLPSPIADASIFRELRNWQYALLIGGPAKVFPGYIFGIAAILGLLCRQPGLAVAAAAISACANVSFVPLFFGVVLGGCLELHRSDRNRQGTLPIALATLGPILFLAYFQYAGGTPTAMAAAPLEGLRSDNLRVSRNIILKSAFYCAFFFGLPILVGLGAVDFKRRVRTWLARPVVLAILITGSSGLCIWAVLHVWVDSVQFFMNPTVVAGNLACILAVASHSTGRRLGLVVLALWGLSLMNWLGTLIKINTPTGRDSRYLRAIASEPPFSPRVGGFIISKEAARQRPIWELLPAIMTPGSLATTRCCAGALPLVDLGPLVAGNAQVERAWTESYFVRFSAKRSFNLSDPEALDQAQLEFTIHHHLRFVVVAENTPIPEWVTIRAERFYTDTATGERFYVIRPDSNSNVRP